MKYIREKKKPVKYWIRKFIVFCIGLCCIRGMYITGKGTSYTNYVPLQETFPPELAIGMAVCITMVLGLTSFIENCPKIYRFVNFLIIVISSYLAISTVSINMIRDHEARIAADPESQRLYARYQNLESQYNRTQALYDSCKAIKWNDGAKGWREQGEDLKIQAQLAFSEWQHRNNELKEMGSIQQEASVMAIAAILPIQPKTIQVISKVILSLINDLSFKFFAFLTSIIFPYYVKIRITDEKESLIARCKQWCVSYISGHRKFEITSKRVDINKQAIIDVFKENQQLSYPRIGEIAAARVRRKSAFSKSHVCNTLKPLLKK
jgi:hypothetical protein